MRDIQGAVFDTDGVLLNSASLHAAAWKQALDPCLAEFSAADPQQPFDVDGEYRERVDGKSRFDGARDCLAARGLRPPSGDPEDPPGCTTIWAIAARKERAFLTLLHARNITPFDDVVPALTALHEAGVRCAAVSASRHARALLHSAGLLVQFETVVDGADARQLGLPGKPAPALFLEAARRLGLAAGAVAVIEDAEAGVQAARRGGFGVVVGLDRGPDPRRGRRLRARGADMVAPDLSSVARRWGHGTQRLP